MKQNNTNEIGEKMNILVCDFLVVEAHKTVNMNVIQAMSKFANVDLVSVNGYYDEFRDKLNEAKVNILDYRVKTREGKIQLRLYSYALMKVEAQALQEKNYDLVVVLAFDTIATTFGIKHFKCVPVALFHHKNTDELSSKLKLSFYNCYKNKVYNILFEDFFAEYLIQNIRTDKEKVLVIPHPIAHEDYKVIETKYDCVGISNSNSEEIIDELINLNESLNANHLHILLRSKIREEKTSNVTVIKGFLPMEVYDQYIGEGKAILIPLPDNYIYRLSASIYDAIAHHNKVVANQADEVFLRVGDKSKKLNFEQRLQLVYAKGVKYFEDQPVAGATINDLDLDFVSDYCKKIGYNKGDAVFYLRHNHDFVTVKGDEEVVSGAAILLFGKNPQRFFPRARVRFVRYEGKTAEVGDRMNVVKDVKFSGRILDQVKDATAFVKTQIRDYTKLGEGAVFQTTPEFPEFCWTELIVNAIAHRDYSIGGTDIQIKMFDDHLTVESPGILPGLVRVNNIREFHFSRNPKIVELLNEYDLVKEFGEGVDRVYRDMAAAGLPEPEYRQSEFMLYATLKNKNWGKESSSWGITNPEVSHISDEGAKKGAKKGAKSKEIEQRIEAVYREICKNPSVKNVELESLVGATKRQIESALKTLQDTGRIHREDGNRKGRWIID